MPDPCTMTCTPRQPDKWQQVAGQSSASLKCHLQPHITGKKTSSSWTTRKWKRQVMLPKVAEATPHVVLTGALFWGRGEGTNTTSLPTGWHSDVPKLSGPNAPGLFCTCSGAGSTWGVPEPCGANPALKHCGLHKRHARHFRDFDQLPKTDHGIEELLLRLQQHEPLRGRLTDSGIANGITARR